MRRLDNRSSFPIYNRGFLQELAAIHALVELSLRLLGTAPTLWWIDRLAAKFTRFSLSYPNFGFSAEQIALIHEQRASCSLLWKPTCLRRALARLWALRRCGCEKRLAIAIGARQCPPKGLDFHAWLASDGIPVGEPLSVTRSYAMIETLI